MTTLAHTRYLKIQDDVWEALKREAEWDHRTVTNLVQKILADWMREAKSMIELREQLGVKKKGKEGKDD